MKKNIILILVAFFVAITHTYAATHTVNTSADGGSGSLRQIVTDAQSGDTIIFAPNVNHIILNGTHIDINVGLTIRGHSPTNRVTIDGNNNSGIFLA